IEKPNAPPACRGHGPASEQLAYEVFHPGAAVAQALQQSNVGKVREACGRSPRACRSQPHAAKAISQDQPQKIGRGLHSARPQKGTRFAGGGFDSCGPAELPQRCLPEFVQERFVSHAMLESDSIRAGKPYVSAYGVDGGEWWDHEPLGSGGPGTDRTLCVFLPRERCALFDLRQNASRKRSQPLALIAQHAELRTRFRFVCHDVEAEIPAQVQHSLLIRLYNERDGLTILPK